MTAAELLTHLRVLGVRVTAEDGRLRVSAARGQLTDDVKAEIAANKPELLALLANQPGIIPRIARGSLGASGRLPLSFFQERLWVLHRLEPDRTDYNLLAAISSSGPVDPEQVATRIVEIVRRHEILRTIFEDDGGVPSARLLAAESVPVEVHDIAGADYRRALDAAQVSLRTPFDLATQPPTRFDVHRISDGRIVTMVTAHHIAVDEWSMRLLGKEVAAAYDPRAEAPPAPAVQYADYAAWQRTLHSSEEIAAALAWWEQQLAGLPPLSTFPPDLPRTGQPTGITRPFALSRTSSEALRSLVGDEGVTVYMALLAACAAALSFHTGQDDLAIGCPMGARERPELETVIGPFVDLLVLRLNLSDDPSFAELLRRARSVVLDAHEHREATFEALIEHLKPARSLEHAPLCQVAVVQHGATADDAVPMLSGGSIFDLMWVVREMDGAYEGGIEYRSDLYSAEAIEGVAARLEAVLTAGVANPNRPLSELDLLMSAELERVRDEFNRTQREIESAPFAIQFERQVVATPNAVALGFEGTQLTYAELDRAANRVARYLAALGIGRGDIIGLHLPRSVELVTALIGIHKSGAAYLPLDPAFPPERLSYMLADSRARGLVTRDAAQANLDVPETTTVIDLGTVDIGEGDGAGDPGTSAGPTDLAYIIYTSGSTGRPKGVRIQHAALSNFLAAMREEPGLSSADVLAAVTTLSFDIAVLELYLPLTVGARVELVASATAQNGVALAEALTATGATIMQATPATWRLLVEAKWTGSRHFRALCGGEPLPPDLAAALLERVGELWNLYGPTETTVWSTAHQVVSAENIAIGRPIANTSVYIMGRHGQLLPAGVVGEICIAGAGVADGYHERPELTAERFVPDPFGASGAKMYRTGDLGRWTTDGVLMHLGRSDYQVKVRGFRIELGEIEAVLATHPAIRQSVLVAHELGPGDVRLVAYVVFEAHEDLTASEVRRHLRGQLPNYMIPALVVTLDVMPLTPNGKVDRAALPDPFASATRRDKVPPAPGLEQTLAEIWRKVLQIDWVGAEDNFFELGGHSLLSLRVAARVEAQLGWKMDPRMLFFQNLRQVAAAGAEAIG